MPSQKHNAGGLRVALARYKSTVFISVDAALRVLPLALLT